MSDFESFVPNPEVTETMANLINTTSGMLDTAWLMEPKFWDPGALAKLKVGIWMLEIASRDDAIIEVTNEGYLTQSVPLAHLTKESTQNGSLTKVYGAHCVEQVVVDTSPFGMPTYTFHRDGKITKRTTQVNKKLGFWASRILGERLEYVFPL